MLFIFSTSRCLLLVLCSLYFPRHAALYFLHHTTLDLRVMLAALYFCVTLPSTSASRIPLLPTSRYPLRPRHAAIYFRLPSSAPRCRLLPPALYFRITLPSASYITLPSTSAPRCPLIPSALYFRATLSSASYVTPTSISSVTLSSTSRVTLPSTSSVTNRRTPSPTMTERLAFMETLHSTSHPWDLAGLLRLWKTTAT